MGYVFISYSTKNQVAADKIRELFIKNNIDTWMAPYNIPVGSKYAEVITKAIRDCSCFALLLSNDSQASEAVDSEVELAALTFKKAFITVELEKVTLNDAFTFYIHNKQIVSLHTFDESSDKFKEIIDVVINYTKEDKKTTDDKISFEQVKSDVSENVENKSEETLIKKTTYQPDSDINNFIIADGVLKKYNGKSTCVAIPDGVTSIGVSSFEYCKKLESVEIPASVTSIERWTFNFCKYLSSINVDENNQKYKSIDGVLFNKDCTELLHYPFSKNVNEYELPNTVIKFSIENKYIERITIPGSVLEIGYNALYNCDNLKNVLFENGVKSISKEAIDYCPNLETIFIPESTEKILLSSIQRCKNNIKFIYIPENSLVMENVEKLATKLKADLVIYKPGDAIEEVVAKKNVVIKTPIATPKTNKKKVSSNSDKINTVDVVERNEQEVNTTVDGTVLSNATVNNVMKKNKTYTNIEAQKNNTQNVVCATPQLAKKNGETKKQKPEEKVGFFKAFLYAILIILVLAVAIAILVIFENVFTCITTIIIVILWAFFALTKR